MRVYIFRIFASLTFKWPWYDMYVAFRRYPSKTQFQTIWSFITQLCIDILPWEPKLMFHNAARCNFCSYNYSLGNECNKGNEGVIPLPRLTLPSISWNILWKICLTNNISKSVFVIVICITNRVEFYIKGIFSHSFAILTLKWTWCNFAMTLVLFLSIIGVSLCIWHISGIQK